MKPFDLEKANAGDKVCLKDGTAARIICWDALHAKPIVALYIGAAGTEQITRNNLDGSGDVQLYMAPVTRTGYIAIHPLNICATADIAAGYAESGDVIAKVTWEE